MYFSYICMFKKSLAFGSRSVENVNTQAYVLPKNQLKSPVKVVRRVKMETCGTGVNFEFAQDAFASQAKPLISWEKSGS